MLSDKYSKIQIEKIIQEGANYKQNESLANSNQGGQDIISFAATPSKWKTKAVNFFYYYSSKLQSL